MGIRVSQRDGGCDAGIECASGSASMSRDGLSFWISVMGLVLAFPLAAAANLVTRLFQQWWTTTSDMRLLRRLNKLHCSEQYYDNRSQSAMDPLEKLGICLAALFLCSLIIFIIILSGPVFVTKRGTTIDRAAVVVLSYCCAVGQLASIMKRIRLLTCKGARTELERTRIQLSKLYGLAFRRKILSPVELSRR